MTSAAQALVDPVGDIRDANVAFDAMFQDDIVETKRLRMHWSNLVAFLFMLTLL